MKTNASVKTIIQAVENVSKQKYDNNVVFRSTPEKLTKNVCRFTLKTLKANKAGSLTNKLGIPMTKANWDVNKDVMDEILRLDPRPTTYVDTIYGRQYPVSPIPVTEKNVEHVDASHSDESQQHERPKRKYTKRKLMRDFNADLTSLEQSIDLIANAFKQLLLARV